MKVTRLGEHIGAEVTGIDLRGPVDAATRRALNAAVVDNVALVIRDQDFTLPLSPLSLCLISISYTRNNTFFHTP